MVTIPRSFVLSSKQALLLVARYPFALAPAEITHCSRYPGLVFRIGSKV